MDQSIRIASSNDNFRQDFILFVQSLLDALDERSVGIGHIKFILNQSSVSTKISITTIADTGWMSQIPPIVEGECSLLINARVQMPGNLLADVIADKLNTSNLCFKVDTLSSFHPGEPKPVHHMTS